MNIADDLERLAALHKNSALSDDEFAQAKRKLLNEQAGRGTMEGSGNFPCEAAS